ncbi:MAG: DnaJ family molecular chaperone [Bacteriovoracia bacterium]
MTNLFSLLDLPIRYDVDLRQLDESFFKISRQKHPDRFAALGIEAKKAAEQEFALINEAYAKIKDSESRLDLLLEIANISKPERSSENDIPKDLAEHFFELQELRMENPEKAIVAAESFSKNIKDHLEQTRKEIEVLATNTNWDALGKTDSDKTNIEQIVKLRANSSYLKSLLNNIDRLFRRQHV